MTKIELRFDHVDNDDHVYDKPIVDDERGPSLLVNQTLVPRHCQG